MNMELSQYEVDVLRRLAERQAEIAALPIHNEKANLWQKLNDLEMIRPMVWINEIPWHEMNVNDELTLLTANPWAREIEQQLQRLLYQWNHMPADMIIEDYISCPLIIHSTGYGMAEDVDIVKTDETSDVVSRRFHSQIKETQDIEKIKLPQVSYDKRSTEDNFQSMCEIFDGILPVKKVGKKYIWFAPWDELIRWWGVQETMTALVDNPQLVNEIYSRLVDAYLFELDQWDALHLLSLNSDNTRIGSGGYGYTDDLPGKDFDPTHLHPANMWGSGTAQIFSAVSPRMHWEFALRHEMRWLERWGLTYYGCCEPLDMKMGILHRIPNLRKISMSPLVEIDRAVNEVQADYVFSRKPSPAAFAWDNWEPDAMRQDLRDFLEQSHGCQIEIIMKDVSTVRYQPQRLWEWEKMAMELVEDYVQ